jgi:hypothetical protein
MTALLGSTLSRQGSTQRTSKQLQHPTTLPDRADPASPDAKILGPLSKRREVNIRWKFFKTETAKAQPPIEASRVHVLQTPAPPHKPVKTSAIGEPDAENAKQPTPPPVGFQGTSVLRDLEAIASPNPNTPKQVKGLTLPDPRPSTTSTSTSTVNRFIRRQHRKILANIPVLTYFKHPNSPIGKYQVSLSPLAHSDSSNGLTSTAPMADEADVAWLRLPPPTEKPSVDLESTPSRGLRAEAKLMGESNWADDGDPPVEAQCLQKEPGGPDPKA